ncbi:MAG: ribonuclease III [Desulfobulbaceae bacterium]|jgi:ribonuclease-3|nr:ribonuclease III [Desulfobulbaceae bacterium]
MTMLDALLIKNKEKLHEFEQHLGYQFKDRELLQESLIHSSYAFEQGSDLIKDNENLEFLGDAVLDLVVGHGLFQHYSQMNEGELTQLRSALVKESHLAQMAREVGMGPLLLLGRGEDHSGGREKDSILSCGFEALVGAIFLDGGYGAAEDVVSKWLAPWYEDRRIGLTQADAKSKLQEMLQAIFNEGPVYQLQSVSGPDHDRTFVFAVLFRDQILAQGEAGNKKKAQQNAATRAIQNFDTFDFPKP